MCTLLIFFFFNDTATTEIYTLSLHDALPIFRHLEAEQAAHELGRAPRQHDLRPLDVLADLLDDRLEARAVVVARSEEHTSELQSRQYLVCRLLLEKKKKKTTKPKQSVATKLS